MILISITVTRVLVWSLAAIARKNRCQSDLFPRRARSAQRQRQSRSNQPPQWSGERPKNFVQNNALIEIEKIHSGNERDAPSRKKFIWEASATKTSQRARVARSHVAPEPGTSRPVPSRSSRGRRQPLRPLWFLRPQTPKEIRNEQIRSRRRRQSAQSAGMRDFIKHNA